MIGAAHDQSRITHQDVRCSAGAIAIAGATALALTADRLDTLSTCAQLSEWTAGFDRILSTALLELPRWIQLDSREAVAEISRAGAGDPGEWEGISPFVTPSVLWSLYAVLRSPTDYWEAICTAIAVGGDVDTTAAMAGAIAGATGGLDQCPTTSRELSQIREPGGTTNWCTLRTACRACTNSFASSLNEGPE
jgi:ADP-ribosylglycohydrolase